MKIEPLTFTEKLGTSASSDYIYYFTFMVLIALLCGIAILTINKVSGYTTFGFKLISFIFPIAFITVIGLFSVNKINKMPINYVNGNTDVKVKDVHKDDLENNQSVLIKINDKQYSLYLPNNIKVAKDDIIHLSSHKDLVLFEKRNGIELNNDNENVVTLKKIGNREDEIKSYKNIQ